MTDTIIQRVHSIVTAQQAPNGLLFGGHLGRTTILDIDDSSSLNPADNATDPSYRPDLNDDATIDTVLTGLSLKSRGSSIFEDTVIQPEHDQASNHVESATTIEDEAPTEPPADPNDGPSDNQVDKLHEPDTPTDTPEDTKEGEPASNEPQYNLRPTHHHTLVLVASALEQYSNLDATLASKQYGVKKVLEIFVLMLEVFKSDLSSSCVHSHSYKRDGRQAYFDFVSLHSKSKAKVYNTSTQLHTLLNLNLHQWKESKVKFITHWFDELEHLNKLRPPTIPLEYQTVKSALCQACSISFQLSKQFAKITDPLDSNNVSTYIQVKAEATHQLKITLLLEATHLDSQALLSAPKSTIRAHYVHNFSNTEPDTIVHDHTNYSLPIEFEDDFQDCTVFKAGRTPDPTTRLPGVIWKTLSRQGMKGWLNIPADDKKKLVACLRSELLPERHHDPNDTKPISRKAYTHDHSVTFLNNEATPKVDVSNDPSTNLHPAVENDRRRLFHASLGVYKSQTLSTKDQRPLKSSYYFPSESGLLRV
eukprot:jgi/Psemu1/20492/gm1.20492_g